MMKKLTTSLLTLVALCGEVAAQEVEVPNVEALQGEEVSLTLQLDVNGGSYTSLEFDIQFPEDGFTTGSGHTAAGWDGAFTIGDVGGVSIDKLARCGVMSYSDTSIPDEGLRTLGTVDFTVPAGIALGNYTVTLTNMTLVGDTRVPVADATFTLSVVDRITLDENSTTAPIARSNVNVRVKRTIKANEWSTICLPFAMTEPQVKAAFGDDVVLKDFNGYTTTEDNDENIVAIEVKFKAVDPVVIEDNHPYVIKVSSAISEFTVNDVDIAPENEPTVAAIERKKKQWSELIGTYVANTTVEENCLFLSDNKFWYSNGSTKMKGFRAYFDFYDVLSEVENASARIDFNFDDTTGIKEIHGANGNAEGTYDLQGRKVEEPVKGLYIVNGRKVVKK
jgi:hypothetical protein